MKYKTKKRFQIVMRIICGLSFYCLIGVAGGSDCGQLSLREVCIYAPICLAVFGLSGWLGGMMG